MKKQNGITLIALIITIIVMLILVAVTVKTVIDSGLFGHAKNATEQWADAQRDEQAIGDNINELLDQYSTGNGDNEKPTAKPYVLAEIMGGANSPDISGFNVENTYYVTWGTTAPYEINETNTIDTAPPNGWSNYSEKEWANIKTTGGGNDCYWVWIPRYAYCITEGYHTNTAKTIDIKFLQGTTNTPIDGSSIEIKNQTGSGNWNVHPAFWFDENNNGIEDEGEQLTGIWVAKYEASSSEVSEIILENGELTGNTESLSGNGGGQNTNLQVRVKPNVTSWRGITTNNIFTVCRNLTASGNSLEGTSGIDSHMMKNTEWGAVAYLSRSVYGKNGEVWNNPYYNNTTNYSTFTGLCGTSATQTNNGTTTNLYKYNTTEGIQASTTGNVYGVYDMVGGAWEYVAGYLSNVTPLTNYTMLASADTKYKDVYAGTSSNRNTNYNANKNKYGDAVYETSSSGDSGTGSWDTSYSYFPSSSNPVFRRGGHASSGSYAGVFAFNAYTQSTGGAHTYNSFRPVVLSSQP